MCFYDVIVALMNINEIKCQISKQAISETSDDNLVRLSAIITFINVYFIFTQSKPLDMTFNLNFNNYCLRIETALNINLFIFKSCFDFQTALTVKSLVSATIKHRIPL